MMILKKPFGLYGLYKIFQRFKIKWVRYGTLDILLELVLLFRKQMIRCHLS